MWFRGRLLNLLRCRLRILLGLTWLRFGVLRERSSPYRWRRRTLLKLLRLLPWCTLLNLLTRRALLRLLELLTRLTLLRMHLLLTWLGLQRRLAKRRCCLLRWTETGVEWLRRAPWLLESLE